MYSIAKCTLPSNLTILAVEDVMNGNWLSTDEAQDVAGSLRHALRTVRHIDEDTHAWKWVLLALHSALQGACVAYLTTTAPPIGAVSKQNAAEWLAYLDASRTDTAASPPKAKIMALPDLLKAARKPHSAGDRSNSEGVTISDAEYQWLLRIHHDVRNQFTHFEPKGWGLEVSGISDFAKLVARIVGEIFTIGWAFRRLDPPERDEMRMNLSILATADWA